MKDDQKCSKRSSKTEDVPVMCTVKKKKEIENWVTKLFDITDRKVWAKEVWKIKIKEIGKDQIRSLFTLFYVSLQFLFTQNYIIVLIAYLVSESVRKQVLWGRDFFF